MYDVGRSGLSWVAAGPTLSRPALALPVARAQRTHLSSMDGALDRLVTAGTAHHEARPTVVQADAALARADAGDAVQRRLGADHSGGPVAHL